MSLKHLTKDLTSYDLLKTFAVLLMLVDHAGYYFFDDDSWWRLFGRFCVPVWFFLIGYARSRDLGPKLWIGMVVLVASSLVVGMGALPVNILGTMLVIRLVLDAVMARAQRTPQGLWQLSVMMVLLTFPTSYLFEYGTLAVIMAMFGWLVRHQHEYPGGERQAQQYLFFALGTFVVLQTMFFGFSGNQILVLGGGILAVMCGLMFFRPVTFAGTGEGFKGVLTSPLRFMGRWTLEIYVAHLLLFKTLGAIYQPDRFPLFDWKLGPKEMFELTVSGVN